nr:helix-turn-helix transcriptional regulator [uncultured Oscillibacter sp.]
MVHDGFPVRLQRLREREGKSRMVLSQLCGLPDGAIRKYERGEARPTVESLVAIADHFRVSTDYLLGRTNY